MKPSLNERGISVMGIIAAMAIFAIGCLSLTQIMFRATRGGVSAKRALVAQGLARERLDEDRRRSLRRRFTFSILTTPQTPCYMFFRQQ